MGLPRRPSMVDEEIFSIVRSHTSFTKPCFVSANRECSLLFPDFQLFRQAVGAKVGGAFGGDNKRQGAPMKVLRPSATCMMALLYLTQFKSTTTQRMPWDAWQIVFPLLVESSEFS